MFAAAKRAFAIARGVKKLRATVDGHDLEFELPPAGNHNSIFGFGLHKAGSSLLNSIIRQASRLNKLPFVDIPAQSVRQGVQEHRLTKQAVGPIFQRQGYAFLGCRAPFDFIPPDALEGRRKVLLIRDPRDMMVSLYFSIKYSHVVPAKGDARRVLVNLRSELSKTEINEFVLSDKCRFVGDNFRAYTPLIDDDWRVFRYEDVIFSKRRWVEEMTSHLGLRLSEDEARRIVDRHDVRPSAERPDEHIRQVAPGNHLKYLKPETIEALNASLADILERYEYRQNAGW